MITYDARKLSKDFAALNATVISAAQRSLQAAVLNEKPALLSFDETETDTLAYTAVRESGIVGIISVSSSSPATTDQLLTNALNQTIVSFEQNLKISMEVLSEKSS